MPGRSRPLPKVYTYKERQRLKCNGTLPKEEITTTLEEAWEITGIDKDRSVLHDQ